MADEAYDLYMMLTDGTRQKVGTIAIPQNGVTGVKGNAETVYRIGNVNLTPENIGAVNKAGDTMTGALGLAADSNAFAVYNDEINICKVASGTANSNIYFNYRGREEVPVNDFHFEQGKGNGHNQYANIHASTFFEGNGQRVYSPNNPPPASGSFHLYEYTIGIDQPICMYVEVFPTIYFQIVSAQNLKVDTEHSADSLGLVGCTYPATGKFRTSITSSTWYNAVKVSISSNGFTVTDGGGNDWCGGDGPVLHSFFYEDSPYFSLFIKSKRQII